MREIGNQMQSFGFNRRDWGVGGCSRVASGNRPRWLCTPAFARSLLTVHGTVDMLGTMPGNQVTHMNCPRGARSRSGGLRPRLPVLPYASSHKRAVAGQCAVHNRHYRGGSNPGVWSVARNCPDQKPAPGVYAASSPCQLLIGICTQVAKF